MVGLPVTLKGHKHLCPGLKKPPVPPIPHVGGQVTKVKQKYVKVGGTLIACKGDKTICLPVMKKGKIKGGSKLCRINGKKIARITDSCAHFGKLVQGKTWITSE